MKARIKSVESIYSLLVCTDETTLGVRCTVLSTPFPKGFLTIEIQGFGAEGTWVVQTGETRKGNTVTVFGYIKEFPQGKR